MREVPVLGRAKWRTLTKKFPRAQFISNNKLLSDLLFNILTFKKLSLGEASSGESRVVDTFCLVSRTDGGKAFLEGRHGGVI